MQLRFDLMRRHFNNVFDTISLVYFPRLNGEISWRSGVYKHVIFVENTPNTGPNIFPVETPSRKLQLTFPNR